MKVYTFRENKNGKIELTAKQLERMLNEAYEDGMRDGERKNSLYWPYHWNYDWTASPSITTTGSSEFINNPYTITCENKGDISAHAVSAGGLDNVIRNNQQILRAF